MYDNRKIKLINNVQNLGEFGGSMRRAILDAGFSQKIADNPSRITCRKWFLEAIPDYGKVAQALHSLMDAVVLDHESFPPELTNEDIAEIMGVPRFKIQMIARSKKKTDVYYTRPHWRSMLAAINICCRIRGDFAPTRSNVSYESEVDPVANLTNEEIEAEVQEIQKIYAQRRLA